MGMLVHSLLWVMQDLYHQPYLSMTKPGVKAVKWHLKGVGLPWSLQ